jgi:hypothetical protein
MPTFKPGDRVRALKDDYRIKAGQVFTVYTAVRSTLELSNGYTYWAANFERVNTTASAKQAQEEMRFETVEPKAAVRRQFQVGDIVRCKDPVGYERHGLAKGKLYMVAEAHPGVRGAPTMLAFRELLDGKGLIFAHRFRLVQKALPEETKHVRDFKPAPFKPHVGSLDEYGPAAPEPEKPNPLFNAINKRFPTHPSDILVHLDELRGE